MKDLEYIFVQLEDYWDKIDRKRYFDRYTMFECQKIAEESIPLIAPLSKYENYDKKVEKALDYFKTAIKQSEKYHKLNVHTDSENIMDVLRNAKFGLDVMLAKA